MPDRTIIANFKTGLETDRKAFIIDNDAFPTLFNAYVWRGRVLKKPGTEPLARLRRDLTSQSLGNTGGTGAFTENVFLILGLNVTQSTASLVPGSLSIVVGAQTFTEPATPNGTLTSGSGGTGTVNYATGDITLQTSPALLATAVTITFGYYPSLPVMGLEDFNTLDDLTSQDLVAFDTIYSYQLDQTTNPYSFYSVSFYKNSGNPVVWSGQDYQQFWSTNYEGALWVTNSKAGLNFKSIGGITQANPGVVTINNHGLVTGDKVWFNEIGGMTQLNGQTATVTFINTNTFSIGIDTSGYSAYTSGGIAQYLTNSISGQDGIRWYDGDPTTSTNAKGWVNFAPPLSSGSTPEYLVGALAILPFKDRLLFFSPTTKTSAGVTTTYKDRIIYSWNGTPYYNAIVPSGFPATFYNTQAYYASPAGFGGFVSAGLQQAMVAISNNQDVILVDFQSRKTKLVYTANDLIPFLFYTINSELGAESTFSTITLDEGGISIGPYGIVLTTQENAQRVDLAIPDSVFNISALENGLKRVTAVRDYRSEFVYFTVPWDDDPNGWVYPTRTLFFNYRDNTWAIFKESYTTYGRFRRRDEVTWAQLTFPSWSSWNSPWQSSSIQNNYPSVLAGNVQGFVLVRVQEEDGSGDEAPSHFIQGISGITITSPNHCLNTDDYIYIEGCLGNTTYNDAVWKVIKIRNSTQFDIAAAGSSGTYLGNGTFFRITRPLIRTKQFPMYWNMGRQMRLGVQKYLFDTTINGEVTVNIYMNQNTSIGYNESGSNSGLVYSSTVLTKPEPGNLLSVYQDQTWHRQSSSVIGDSVQVEITLSDEQMSDDTLEIQRSPIVLHAIVLEHSPSSVLAY